ncbi:hypothetical protein HAX54_049961 [Datura stramonium]|uniref:Uncharacterized protein n=1 Tax=Datura stramonium TaxID=4076 RepID=A0ABS8WNQ1_DATST|nr:hypothetical protein [Datura stramonium]
MLSIVRLVGDVEKGGGGKEKLERGVRPVAQFSGGSRWRREGEIKGRGCRSLVRRGGRLCGGDYGGFNGVAPVFSYGGFRRVRSLWRIRPGKW